ncbi:MAG: hypothetical protein P0Y53_23795 [Candidatus Pseudobacter hemicellulosilyticus]|uniref:Uncharacterized protein n=1 Tax=Candidatus Pseudobacter hemicellulosilyticus TaxID=3121375 RepID=A0AAJ6BFD0_9BACT|nr:MAG: hypothetical protein P0Y53_23795 [Pseudobacter sp.]
MNNAIIEKRKIAFEHIRITPEIIRSVATIVDTEVKHIGSHGTHCFYLYSVDADDDSSYESQAISIFTENILIEQKIIDKISMRFHLLDNSKNIEIQFTHIVDDDDKGENFVQVSGIDSNWVNGVLNRIIEVIDNAEPQPKCHKLIGYGAFFLAIIFTVLYYRVIHSELTKWNESIAGVFLLTIIVCIAGGFIKLYDYLIEMYPLVELQTGPNYHQIPVKNRKKITFILVAILIPLLLGLIYDLGKSYILK